jgi:hypothetical protein
VSAIIMFRMLPDTQVFARGEIPFVSPALSKVTFRAGGAFAAFFLVALEQLYC